MADQTNERITFKAASAVRKNKPAPAEKTEPETKEKGA